MNDQNKLPKIPWVFVGIVAIAAIVFFSVVASRSSQSQNASGKNHEQISKPESTWEETFRSSFGKDAPDFSIKDINGNMHKLSDYLGKSVVVVFWATWCPACNLEIPHLIELRKTFSEDKLAILAISNEEPERLREFVESKGMNYTVASIGEGPLPKPFADVTSIPTSFFIDPEGKIKFAALGLVPLADTKTIMNIS